MPSLENEPHSASTRRRILKGLAATAPLALLSGCNRDPAVVPKQAPAGVLIDPPAGEAALDSLQLGDAIELLGESISIDLHSHPGAFFFNGMATPEDPAIAAMSKGAGFEQRTMADMNAGGLSAAVFSTVADALLIGAGEGGLFARREFAPGEAYADHQRQLALLLSMVDSASMRLIRHPDEILVAKQSGALGAILGTEGGDFLEQNPERVEEAHGNGIRIIGLVHYHVNDIGDIQTADAVHGGLTDFGREAVAEMNRVGILADLAHATFATTRDAAEASSAPIMISHSFLAEGELRHPRLLSEDHARLVAGTGGIIGGWPSGVGTTRFSEFVDRLFRLVDLVGIDHVGLGTDMDANFKPVFSNYRQLPYLPHALAARGMSRPEIDKLLGGNFLRVLHAVAAESKLA